MSRKIAVVLFNLGCPDSKESIEPFLMNFFMDKNIISAPLPVRYLLAKYISFKRSRREAGESYGELGNKSPLLENTYAQAKSLEKCLNNDENIYKTFVSMRYWHPMSMEVLKDVQKWNPDKVILLPLYPQFSTTTTGSSIEDWKKSENKLNYHPETSVICCYNKDSGFVNASADNICVSYKQAIDDGHKNLRILFSAHGLPEKIIESGDPYQYQCEKSAEKIADLVAEKLGKEIDWQICYQSKVGRLKWIEPSIDQSLEKAAKDNKSVIIYPHAFTQEHVETLVELDIEYKEVALSKGIKGYYRSNTVGTSEDFINGLAEMIKNNMDNSIINSGNGTKICPNEFCRCINEFKEK